MSDLDLKNSRRILKLQGLPQRSSYGPLTHMLDVTLSFDDVSSISHQVAMQLYPAYQHHWSFNNADFSGTTLYDLVGSLDGTMINTPTTGETGSMLDGEAFNFVVGNSEYVNLGSGTELDFSGDFSVSTWVVPNSNAGGSNDYRIITNRGIQALGVQSGWAFGLQNRAGGSGGNSRVVRFYLEDGGFYDDTVDFDHELITTTSSSNKGLYHLVGTFDSSTGTKKVYYQGQEIHSSVNANLIGATFNYGSNASIAAGQDTSANQYFSGRIDDIKVWNSVALTADDVKAIFGEQAEKTAIPSATGYYSFNTGDYSGSTVTDLIGSNDGTVTGATLGAAGKAGEGISFSTANDWVDLGTAWDFTGDWTVCFWFRNSTGGGSNKRLVQNRGTGGYGTQAGWYCRLESGANFEVLIDKGNGTYNAYNVSNSVKPDVWYHVGLVWDSSAGKIEVFQDGAMIGISTLAGLANVNLFSGRESTLGISKVGGSYAQDFNGFMDEVIWWDGTALTEAEIRRVYWEGEKGNKLV